MNNAEYQKLASDVASDEMADALRNRRPMPTKADIHRAIQRKLDRVKGGGSPSGRTRGLN